MVEDLAKRIYEPLSPQEDPSKIVTSKIIAAQFQKPVRSDILTRGLRNEPNIRLALEPFLENHDVNIIW